MIELLTAPERRAAFSIGAHSTHSIFATLSHLEDTYPGFRAWFYGKVGSPHSREERATFVQKRNGRICGIAIAKRSFAERKLCTLWVQPEARTSGIAAELGAQAFEWLGTRKPLFTVPEERIPEFRTLLNRWDFQVQQTLIGYYRPERAEYVFNGQLKPNMSA